ncbi:MAG TPA: hypothetical protein VFW14_02835 [Gaiellales bacterium]|nr:hypothetical protein [Gaiellales bacterium]
MGPRRSIVAEVAVAAVIGGVGWMASPHALPRPGPPYTADFGVPRVDRATGRVVASGTITNLLSSPLRFEVHLECNPHTPHIKGFGLHSRPLVAVPHASQSWTAWSAVLRPASSDLAHIGADITCAYWFATPGVEQ